MVTLAWIALGCAALPCLLFLWNLCQFTPPPSPGRARPGVSVLIPARNEADNIGACIESVLATRGADVEVVVLDDRSEDDTARVVEGLAAGDQRVRLARGPRLPAGWCGKQHACHLLAAEARRDLLMFVDADVRLEPDAVARMVAFLEASRSGLVSGFPRQVTESALERLLLPLIQWVLLGFLPFVGMRRTLQPGFAAGCGQLFLARRADYERSGGHATIRASRHDGITLPASFRRAGVGTDVCDATGVASCRMYHSWAEVWSGLAKNATEGLGAPARILPFTTMLVLGQVLAPVLALLAAPTLFVPSLIAVFLPRALAAWRFRQPVSSVALHPVGVVVLLAIQWRALWLSLRGRPATWRGRAYEPA